MHNITYSLNASYYDLLWLSPTIGTIEYDNFNFKTRLSKKKCEINLICIQVLTEY